ncbi:hypothetical protein M378DRAFT_159736 [Amanita muscaria Koide BX008]|uniref:F-box domain-containing protein n=1 Tax=Amanita muscaria (strain Koide BX008) TaxID=946122 RepID=A0A0C2XCZ9_AMAMK|nr:hypothetical protein M378DRAFT_159736 [Amanita muscaria Koide BX008]
MLNNTSSSLSSSGYYDARLDRADGRKRAKRKSFEERHFPFHRLPREIIAEIFVLCVPDIEDVFKSKDAAPLLLCNVSSSWRSLAFGIPRLWNELSIQIVDPKVDIDLAIAMAESWVARSGELPLSLRLRANAKNEKEDDMLQAHLDAFFRYASRWEYIDISLFECSEVSFPKFGPTPLLRTFSYSTSWGDNGDPCPFTSCPLLSTITWPFSCSIASYPGIPWHQLTHITLDTYMSTHQTLDILRACKMLVEFNVEIDNDTLDQFQLLQKPVENRSLRSFHICVHITCSGLLQSLSLPALTDLSLDFDWGSLNSTSARSVHTQLLRLFTRSRCRLEKLKLGNCRFNDAGILKCFQHHSCWSLTELEISNTFNLRPMFTDRVILALTNENDLLGVNNVLLPDLSRLSLNMCVSASPGVLGCMVLNRCLWWDDDDRFKSLSLIAKDLDETDVAFLEMAKKLGLDVYFHITTIHQYTDSESAEDLYDTDDS